MDMKCDICGGESVLIHSGTRDDPSINVYECKICHTKQLDIINNNDYENGFMNGKKTMSNDEINERIKECRIDDLRRASSIAEWCNDKTVLDFGCGFGGFIDAISSIAKRVSGVELGLAEREYLIQKGIDVHKDISELDNQFDVITLFHVFEHLKEPREWLRIISEHLKDGGVLFIEVPNSNDALLSLYKCDDFADFTYWSAHLYLYTIDSLTMIINDNGSFDIESDGQVQRYPLANHLYWLASGKPGGQKVWGKLSSKELEKQYYMALSELGLCDTLFFRLRKKFIH